MNAAVETESERVVLFQQRGISDLVVNLSGAETTSAGAYKAAYRVATKQAGRLAEALQEEHITRVVLGFGNFAGVWCAADDIKTIELIALTYIKARKELEFMLPRYLAAGIVLVAVGAATPQHLMRHRFRNHQFRAQGAAGAAFAPAVLLANALNNERADEAIVHELGLENNVPADTRPRRFSAYDRLEDATLLAARHAGVSLEAPSAADMVRLVCRGMDIFSEALKHAGS